MKTTILITTTAVLLSFASSGLAMGKGMKPNFENIDLDNNGEISLSEFQAIKTNLFGSIDVDNSGTISAAEIEDMGGRRSEKMMSYLDEDNNNEISKEEFFSHGPQFTEEDFAEADADNSGGLSKKEMKQSRKDKRSCHHDEKDHSDENHED